jgi:hypothetical protein
MARDHARLLTSIWDPTSEFRQLPADAQRVYMLLVSQRSINHAGVLPLTVRKWANCSPDTTVEDVWSALKVLAEERYIVVDQDTEEVLVRSYIRNDGVAKQPNVLKAALRLAEAVESPKLRVALASELRRLGMEHAGEVADALVAAIEAPAADSEPNPSVNPSPSPSGTLPFASTEPLGQNAGVGEGEVVISRSVVTSVSATSTKPRPKTASKHHAPDPAAFDAFWDAYPRKVGKQEAIRAYTKALKITDSATLLTAIVAHAAYWAKAGRDQEGIPHAATWLNNRRWEDQLAGCAPARADPVRWLREQWQAGRVSEIRKFFNVDYQEPAHRGDGDYWTDVLKPHNQAWITAHHDAIVQRLKDRT